LMCLAPGLLLFSMNNILARAFFALGDIKTPMKISVFCLVLNLLFAIYLVQQYREAGLAVANTISAMFNTGLLFFALRRKLKRLEMQGLIGNVMALIGIATVAGGVAYFVFRYWNQTVGHEGLYARIGAVFVPGIIAGVIYWLLALAAKVPAAMEVTSLVRRKLWK
jgi:putative peptidoglycan lipid II flippase